MNDEHKSSKNPEEKLLLELIRRIQTDRDYESIRPDEDAIEAYILGFADEKQKQAVYKALVKSPRFQRELLEDTREVDSVISGERADVEKEHVEVPEANEIFKRIFGAGSSDEGENRSRISGLKKFFKISTYVAIPAAAVIALIVISINIWTVEDLKFDWQVNSRQIQPSSLQLRRLDNREIRRPPVSSPEQAALMGINSVIALTDEGEIEFYDRTDAHYPAGDSYQDVVLLFRDKKGEVRSSQEVSIPVFETLSEYPPEAWLLSVSKESWVLYGPQAVTDTVTVVLSDPLGYKGGVTFTYRTPDGYLALPGFTFKRKQ